MHYIIERQESAEIKKGGSWLLVYGRRKTGKTFLLRRLCNYKNYLLVKKDRTILFGESSIGHDQVVKTVTGLLEKGKTVVLDEFQRLDESVLEDLMQAHPKGKLIISGSSSRIIKTVFSRNSPLLGFFLPVNIGLINPEDVLVSLSDLKPEQRIEFAAFLRDPWLIPFYIDEQILEFTYKIIMRSKHIIPALIGEVFVEEQREMSKKYAAIMSYVGSGNWSSNRLANLLYSRKFINDPSPTHVIQYLKNLEEMGIIESNKLYKAKNRYYYRLRSPIMNLYYYLEDRYNIANREVTLDEMKPTLQKLINLEIQNFIADVFAEYHKGRKELFFTHDEEIDFIITKRNKASVVGEVKWKDLSEKDINRFEKKTSRFFCRKIIVGKKIDSRPGKVEALDSKDIVGMYSGKVA